ncbi:hypothetical protein L2E82_35871 [Cichorium intybus]|uniref:Uncharacterized protein n=1 Tax=Cichorium intybus TaxID=13427 RepID=A0ACB9BQ48_CICIN|nr:hypothetical protein L2E82_35871 [Cichorium intybus]
MLRRFDLRRLHLMLRRSPYSPPQLLPGQRRTDLPRRMFYASRQLQLLYEYTSPNDSVVCGNTTSKSGLFGASVRQAVGKAVMDASRNWDYFARESLVKVNESVFVMAQCWRTLSPAECRACLDNASAALPTCLPWSEGRALNTGCFMRYSDTDFLNPIPVPSSSSNRVKAIARKVIAKVVSIAKGVRKVIAKVVSIAKGVSVANVVSLVSSVAIIIIILMIIVYIWKYRYLQKKRKGSYDAKKLTKILNDSSLNFKYSTVEKATANWDECNKLGQGGFGTVYKGVLSDGREIAVKRLFFNNKFRATDLYNEVNMISSVEHKNLVRLLGCSCSGPESILIYEYLPNMSLDHFIFDMRLRAKIADFGLARSFQDDQSHISTAIAGTLFGVLLLEIVTGMGNNRRKTIEYTDTLLSIAWKHFQENTVEEIFDPNLMMHLYPNTNYQKEVKKVVQVGLLCIQEAPSLRPSMSAVLRMLAKDEPLPVPSNPPFIDGKTMELNKNTRMIRYYNYRGDSSSIATVSHSHFFPR